MGPDIGYLVVLSDDLFIGRRLRQLAREHALAFADPGELADEQDALPVAVAVLDLQLPDAAGLVGAWRARWPEALLAGFIGVPDRERWVAAQRAGCDLVVNRGALVPRLRRELAARGGPRVRRFPLFEAADAAGRLGLVFRTGDTPVGPLAAYQVEGRLYAVADRCPHAGAALSSGETESAVVTCPGHGSQFDLRTGERLRGPADRDVAVFPLVHEGGQICLLLRG